MDLIANEISKEAMAIIKKGAFLTVKSGDELNTMTIGWATIGHIWRKEVLMVAVRESRHTFSLIENAADFTVSAPMGDQKKAVMFCGTKSGRDLDKFKACNLGVKESKVVTSPIIDLPGYHFECNIVYKTAMDPGFLDRELDKSLYADNDYHTLYFGEIKACYSL
jgi:flavin reductase (DIM6/NTAB) family NADH-FMN oxidoreductase RutF